MAANETQQFSEPINLQVLSCLKLEEKHDGRIRYRMILSDGEYYSRFGMLAPELNNVAETLCGNTIIRINSYRLHNPIRNGVCK